MSQSHSNTTHKEVYTQTRTPCLDTWSKIRSTSIVPRNGSPMTKYTTYYLTPSKKYNKSPMPNHTNPRTRGTQYMCKHRKNLSWPQKFTNPNCTLCQNKDKDTWQHLLSLCNHNCRLGLLPNSLHVLFTFIYMLSVSLEMGRTTIVGWDRTGVLDNIPHL